MKRPRVHAHLVILFWGLGVATPASVLADTYRVVIDKATPRVASVVAEITPLAGEIYMNDEGVHGLENGWATFVENLTVTTEGGQSLEPVAMGLSRWKLEGYKGGSVRLSYRMRLGHDQVGIKFGDNGAAYALPEAVMWAGRALFIAGKAARDLELVFDVSPDWRVTSPWERTPGQGNRFRVHSTNDLVNSAFMAGTHNQVSLRAGSVTVRLALAGENTLTLREDILERTRRYLTYYEERFHSATPACMLLIAADRNDWGGEVMGRAISISVGGELSPGAPPGFSPLSVLAHVIAHEIFHAFSLVRMEMAEDPGFSNWFNEGFGAEYASWLARLRLGEISENQFLQQMSGQWAKYRAMVDGERTLTSAGLAKAENYDMVYSGGLIAALTLDFQIRNQSDGKKSLEDLWVELLRRYPRGGESLDFEKVKQLTLELFGKDVAKRLVAYTQSADEIPFLTAADLVGISFAGEKLSLDPGMTPEQEALWRRISTR